ncbi:MAG TPA: hypothetical protein VF893_07335, partial [Candidatus Bathyarchaeia archaeon]
MRTDSELDPNFEPVKLGKKVELKYIPFSELAIPWNVCVDTSASRQENRNTKQSQFSALKQTNNA